MPDGIFLGGFFSDLSGHYVTKCVVIQTRRKESRIQSNPKLQLRLAGLGYGSTLFNVNSLDLSPVLLNLRYCNDQHAILKFCCDRISIDLFLLFISRW